MKTIAYVIVGLLAFAGGIWARASFTSSGLPRSEANLVNTISTSKPHTVVELSKSLVFEKNPSNALRALIGLNGGDPQSVRAYHDSVMSQFKSWLLDNAPDAVNWLVNARSLPGPLRRKLAVEAAKTNCNLLLKASVQSPSAAQMLDFLSIGLSSYTGLGKSDLQSIYSESLKCHPGAGEFVLDCWCAGLKDRDPKQLLVLADVTKDIVLKQKVKDAVLTGLASKKLSAAIDLINESGPSAFSTTSLAHVISHAKPEDLGSIVTLYNSLPPSELMANALANAGNFWPEYEQSLLLQQAADLDPVTKHVVSTHLLPLMKTMSEDMTRIVLDETIFDQAAQTAAFRTMTTKGDLQTWVLWIQERGGLPESLASNADKALGSMRPADYQAWQATHPNLKLSQALLRK